MVSFQINSQFLICIYQVNISIELNLFITVQRIFLSLILIPCVNYSKQIRSEERRVGKECRSRCDWSTDEASTDLSQPRVSTEPFHHMINSPIMKHGIISNQFTIFNLHISS